jgi:hypothetical protein
MSPAGRNASVAPESNAALSSSVVTYRSWWFAGWILGPATEINIVPPELCEQVIRLLGDAEARLWKKSSVKEVSHGRRLQEAGKQVGSIPQWVP